MAESKWNGVRYDFGDETEGPFDGPEGPPSALPPKPGAVAADLARRKRKPAQAASGGAPAGSTREFYDRQLQAQDAARQASVQKHGMSGLAARTSMAADQGQAYAEAGAKRALDEQRRREGLQRTLIERVQSMMLPFQRAGLPPGGR